MSVYTTPWKIVTSEETSVSLALSYCFGTLYAEHDTSGEKMTIKYRCLSLGAGKGAPVGAAWSNTSDPSGGMENVSVFSASTNFSPWMFPCRGYILGAGASTGVLGSILGMDVTGGGVTVVEFGQLPVLAAVRLWGLGRGAFPGAGLSGGLAHFWLG